MYLGRIVERGSRDTIFARPSHPYTRALLTSAPTLQSSEAAATAPLVLHGEPPSATHVPSGCRLHPRCPRAEARCSAQDPALLPVGGDASHLSACHFRDALDRPALDRPGVTPDLRPEVPDR
jgi:peptide/nickel transport system ATP-binding protein